MRIGYGLRQNTRIFHNPHPIISGSYRPRHNLLFGNIDIMHSAMIQLMRNNIDTVFLTRYGRYLGRLAPSESKNAFLRKKQYRLLDDAGFGLLVVHPIVAGKLSNMATIMRY